MTDWRAKTLEELATVDAEIRRNQDEKKRITKEYAETIKELEEIRDKTLDQLAGETGGLFDEKGEYPKEVADGKVTSTIELDEGDTNPDIDPGNFFDAPEEE